MALRGSWFPVRSFPVSIHVEQFLLAEFDKEFVVCNAQVRSRKF
jgi:hypothetical protein